MTVTAGAFERIYDPSVGEADRWYINDHTIIRDHTGTWHLIGITHAEPFFPKDEKHLAHATASSLHGPWAKQPFVMSTDATLGETHLWAPHVIHHDGTYWMFVCVGGEPETAYRIHLATSPDCVSWTRHPENPMIVDGYEARDPMVLRVGDRWVMYYTATSEPEGGNHIIAAAESDDLVHWSGRHVVYRDELIGSWGGPTESPFVVERDGRFHLFMGPSRFGEALERMQRDVEPEWASVYSTTLVLESDDPLHFDRADEVGFIEAHASEVIVDEQSDMWISHCGWGQRGVYLAPLSWT